VDGYATQLILVAALVLINALFAGSEIALVSLRESQLRQLERHGRRGRALARLARDPTRYLATIQIGITLAGFLASATAAVSLAGPLVPLLGFLGAAARPAAIVTVTVILTFFTLVVGELAPKRIAMQRAEPWALLAAPGVNLLSTLSRPVVWLLARASDLLVRAAGADPAATREEVSTEEIRDLIASQLRISTEQRTIISGAFEIADRTVREILVPRREVVTLPADLPAAEAVTVLAMAGHTRAPVIRGGNLDDAVGVVHLRDLVGHDGTVGDHAERPPLFLPDTLAVVDALRQMRAAREHLALVVDERGATDGIVALEDVLEEVVGEIYDETDRDVQAVTREPDGSLVIPGGFPLHDLPDIGVHLDRADNGGYTTVAGLLLDRLGHIPTGPGATVPLDGWTAQVAAVQRRAITAVRLRPGPIPPTDAFPAR
jgi:putative hemolysin